MADQRFLSGIQQQELLPSIVSVIVPLVQLLSVVVVGLTDTFHVASLLAYPDILNLVNLLTMLVTISVIGWFWYWRDNITWVGWDEKKPKSIFDPAQRKIEKLVRVITLTTPVFLIVFVVVTIIVAQGFRPEWKFLWACFQYLSYTTLLTLSGFLIYIWISEFVKKKQSFQREDFMKNLLSTLSEYGLIPRPEVAVHKNDHSGSGRNVEIAIGKDRWVLKTSLDGLEITEARKAGDNDVAQNLSILDLQSQVQALLAQIAALQGGSGPRG